MNETERSAIREMLRRRSAERAGDPDLAKQWLIEEGLYDDQGRLHPQYGGQTDGNAPET